MDNETIWDEKLKSKRKKINKGPSVIILVGDGYGNLNPNDYNTTMDARKKGKPKIKSRSSVKMKKSKGVKSVAGKVKKKTVKRTTKKTTTKKKTTKRKTTRK